MRKVSVKPRHSGLRAPLSDDSLRYDDARRLKNALVALAELDPGWMYWVDRHISKSLSLRQTRIHVERQARVLMARKYRFIGGWYLFISMTYSDFFFTDNGDLLTIL